MFPVIGQVREKRSETLGVCPTVRTKGVLAPVGPQLELWSELWAPVQKQNRNSWHSLYKYSTYDIYMYLQSISTVQFRNSIVSSSFHRHFTGQKRKTNWRLKKGHRDFPALIDQASQVQMMFHLSSGLQAGQHVVLPEVLHMNHF